MKLLGFVVTLSGSFCLAVSLQGHEVTTCQSPDRKFALRCVYADKQPYNGEAAIVDRETHKNVFSLDPNWTLGYTKLVWSADSKRVAYFFEKGETRRSHVFSPNNRATPRMTFAEVFPMLPSRRPFLIPDPT